jgi:hypothetical protein
VAWGSCYTPDYQAANILGALLLNTTQANDRRLLEEVNGTPTFVLDAIDTGRYAMRCTNTTTAAAVCLPLIAAAGRYAGVLFRFQRVSGAVANSVIAQMRCTTAGDNIRIRLGSTGLLGYSFNNGTSYTDTALNLNTGVHNVEIYVDWNVSTTHTLKIRVDGTEVVNTTGGAATVTTATGQAPVLVGGIANAAYVIDYADIVTYNDVAQYAAMSDWRVNQVSPTSDATHSMTANDFQDDASTNLTNSSTGTSAKVDEVPATVTDFVKQVVVRSTSYMEWNLGTVSDANAGTPVLVCLVAAMHPVGGGTLNAAAFRLNSGGNLSSESALDTSLTSNTLEWRKHHYTTEPGGAAWTLAKANALKARFGYDGTSIASPPALDAIQAWIVAPHFTTQSGAAALTGTGSSTTTGTSPVFASCYTPEFRAESIIGASTGSTAANDRRLVEDMPGTSATFVLNAIDTGRYAMRCDVNAGSRYLGLATLATTPRYAGLMCRFKIASAGFTTNLMFLNMQASTSSQNIRLRVNATTGILAYSFDNGGTWTNSATTLVLGQVYRLEVFVDYGVSTTHTLKVRLDAVEIINTTGGTATSTALVPHFGSSAASASMIVDFADMASYTSASTYATVDDWRVIGLEPTVDGTHSMTANDFQDASSTNLTNSSTGTYAHVDDAPGAAPDTTDFVKQVVARSTSYMEWQLRAMPSGYATPLLVCLAAAMHPVAGTTTNAAAFRLISGANASTETAIDTSIAADTLEYRKHHYQTEPGGAAWTTAKVQAPLRARFGYDGASIVSPPALDSVMAFVLAPVSPTGGATINGAAALTGAGSSTTIGVVARSGTAGLTGLGSLTAAAIRKQLGVAPLIGAGTLTAAGLRKATTSSALSGAGTSSVAATRKQFASVILTGLGSTLQVGFAKRFAQSSLLGQGTLSATSLRKALTSSTLTGQGTLAATGTKIHVVTGQATLTGLGSLAASGERRITSTATLTGQGSLAAAGQALAVATAHLTCGSSMLVTATRIVYGEADLACGGLPTGEEPPPVIVTGGGGPILRIDLQKVGSEAHLFGLGSLHATGTTTTLVGSVDDDEEALRLAVELLL